MKTPDHPFRKLAGLVLSIGMILPFSLAAQCVNNMATQSYDSVLTGLGYGNFQLNFPKWNPDSGLLASVRINAQVSVQYAFTLKNVDLASSTYSLWVGREDLIGSPAMSQPYDNITEQKIGVFLLAPGGVLSRGPFSLLHNYVNTDSLTGNMAPFLGIDSVSFSYSPDTYTTLHTNNNSSYSYSSTALDTVHFSLTYLYCKGAGILAANLTRFTAVLLSPATVQLDWSAVDEQADLQYRVQRSRDGQHFTTIASLPSAATDYTYDDRLPAGATGKWYYRLQMTGTIGNKYSEIKELTVTAAGSGMSVYPDPAINFVNLVFIPGANSGAGWKIEWLAVDGKGVFSGNYMPSNIIQIPIPSTLSAGVYFVRATDLQGHRQFIQRVLKQ